MRQPNLLSLHDRVFELPVLLGLWPLDRQLTVVEELHGAVVAQSGLDRVAAPQLRGCLAGTSQLDDRYLALLQRHGDTTDAAAQIQTLRSLGIEAELRTDGRIEQLIAQLRLGIPVPVGWLHKGPVAAPSGGGHWSLVIGWDPTRRAVLMHDPNGEADLVGGGYVSIAIGSGRNRWYSEKNWGRRWMVEGLGSGWWLELAE